MNDNERAGGVGGNEVTCETVEERVGVLKTMVLNKYTDKTLENKVQNPSSCRPTLALTAADNKSRKVIEK